MSKPVSEHENWLRYWCVDQSRQINKYSRDVDKVLTDARKIAAYVMDKPQAEVLLLTTPGASQGGEA